MSDKEIGEALREWEENLYKPWVSKRGERKAKFETRYARIPLKPLYTPLDVKGSYVEKIGFPGQYPFTRGIYPTMYRGRLWTIRQYSGYGTPEETNKLFKKLLEEGETGLSLAFDLPTQCGYDSDHPLAYGEVGRVGVAINTLRDMELVFDGIPLDKVSTNMTINATAPMLLAMYIAVAEKQGLTPDKLAGTVQNDILKEVVARHAWAFDLDKSMKLVVDVIEFCTKNMPRWNPISITEYHFRESGADSVTAAAFMIADAIEYVRHAIERGLDVDSFAPRISFHLAVYPDLFEEVARIRALRRLWARVMKEKFGAKQRASMTFRFAGTGGGGVPFTRQQPLVNIIRGTLGLLACVLGGAQTAWVTCYDEGYEIPSVHALTIGIRTAQVIAEETSIPDVIDPLAGSYFIEWLTDEMEERIEKEVEEIERRGGALKCIKEGYFQRKIADSAYEWQKRVESGEITVIGLNKYVEAEEEPPITLYKPNPLRQQKAIESKRIALSQRDPDKVREALRGLREAAESGENVMPTVLQAVKAYCTIGEMCDVLREVYGEYKEVIVF